MPRTKRTYARRTYRRKNKRKSKLADSKINTLVEKRMKQIAKDEIDKKGMTICRDNFTSDGKWDQNISRPLNPVVLPYATVEYKNISQCAQQYWGTNPLGVQGDILGDHQDTRPPFRKYRIGVKTVQSHLWFLNFFPFHITVRACILFIPNLNSNTTQAADALIPDIHMMGASPSQKFSGIFGYKGMLKSNSNLVNSAKTAIIVASKTFTLQPRRVDNIYTNTSPAGADSFNVVDNISVPGRRKITLSRTYKNPKMLYANSFNFQENSDSQPPPQIFSNGNYYITVCHDAPYANDAKSYVAVYGMSGLKLTPPETVGRTAIS